MQTQLARSGPCLPKRAVSGTVAMAPKRQTVVAHADIDVPLIMCTSTALCLAAGRFVARPNGIRYDWKNSLGDDPYPKEEQFFKSVDISNDPAGFSFTDCMAYGGLGHIIGYGCMASLELQEILANKEGAYAVIPFIQLLQGVPYDQVTTTIEATGL